MRLLDPEGGHRHRRGVAHQRSAFLASLRHNVSSLRRVMLDEECAIYGSEDVAIVTGGASGLGEATARALAASGAQVLICDVAEARGEDVALGVGGHFCLVD